MNSKEKDLSIILPAYEEAENLKKILPRISNTLVNFNFEILVVDTVNPLDDTNTVCNENGARYIRREIGNNFGDAIRTGIKSSLGKVIVFMDADGSHDPEFIPKLLEHINEYDVVIASRYTKGGNSDNTLLLRIMSKILNISYSYFLNIPCKDISNSFKAYQAEAIRELNLVCDNFDIVEEILFKLSKAQLKIRIKEVPFSFKKRKHGKTKRNIVHFIFTYIFTMIKLRFGK